MSLHHIARQVLRHRMEVFRCDRRRFDDAPDGTTAAQARAAQKTADRAWAETREILRRKSAEDPAALADPLIDLALRSGSADVITQREIRQALELDPTS
jgi:hypothetical protein